MSVGEVLKEARLEAGLTQLELGQQLGLDQPAISAVERDDSKSPSHVTRVAELLGVAVDTEAPPSSNGTEEGRPFRQDAPPKIKKQRAPRKKAAPKGGGIPLAVQLQLPYQLLANVSASQLPSTSNVLLQQAPVCAEAWDQFLMRYPALREKIEQGMIAGDVIGLIMAHLPIIQVAREEMAFRAAQAAGQTGYAGGIDQAG